MGRIRSVHPGLFTDEAFVTVSEAAQIFFVGLLVEADDQGIFEWKPVTLRLRLRGNKDGPVEPILAELSAVDSIRSYELGGRKYGAIRNFCKYQRPKKPNSIHPITEEIRTYVALSGRSSELESDEGGVSTELDGVEAGAVRPEHMLSSELSIQREDVGGRRKDVEKAGTEQALVPPEPPVITIPTNKTGVEYPVSQTQATEFQKLYPAVDVLSELRKMRGWAIGNERKRKTIGGMPRFITGWLAKEQNRPHPELPAQSAAPNGHTNLTADEIALLKSGALRDYAEGKPWPYERYIGPAPHCEGTKITPAELAAVPGAQERSVRASA